MQQVSQISNQIEELVKTIVDEANKQGYIEKSHNCKEYWTGWKRGSMPLSNSKLFTKLEHGYDCHIALETQKQAEDIIQAYDTAMKNRTNGQYNSDSVINTFRQQYKLCTSCSVLRKKCLQEIEKLQSSILGQKKA